MINMNSCHFRKLSDVDIAHERVIHKIWNNIAENYGLIDYFYLGAILTLKNLLDTKCQLDKELVLEYLRAYRDIEEVSTEIKGVINATIKEHEDNNKSKDNLRKE